MIVMVLRSPPNTSQNTFKLQLVSYVLVGACVFVQVNDRGLYVPGQMWLRREDILGRARGTLRYVGMVTIILNDYPPLK